MPQKLIKRIIQKQVWTIKKKSLVQVLTPRCRRDGEPEYGRFTTRDIERIFQIANLHAVELVPHFKDLPNIGNYMMAYSSMIDLAICPEHGWLLSVEKEADCAENEGSIGAYGKVLDTSRAALTSSIAAYGLTFLTGLFRWVLAEEIGWCGWLFPKLQNRMSPVMAYSSKLPFGDSD